MNLLARVVERVVLAVYADGVPSPDEMGGYAALLKRHGVGAGLLLCREDGGPTHAQLRALALLGAAPQRVAVVSGSARVRATVGVVAGFRPHAVGAFPRWDVIGALRFLDVPRNHADTIQVALRLMRLEIEQRAAADTGSGPAMAGVAA